MLPQQTENRFGEKKECGQSSFDRSPYNKLPSLTHTVAELSYCLVSEVLIAGHYTEVIGGRGQGDL